MGSKSDLGNATRLSGVSMGSITAFDHRGYHMTGQPYKEMLE